MSVLDPKARDAWLARFEKAAVAIPEPRRSALRAEVLADFEMAEFPDDLDAYPLPEELVRDEVAAASGVSVDDRRPVRRRTLAIGAVVIIMIAVLLAAVLPVVLVIVR